MKFTAVLFWAAAVCCVVAELVLLRSLLFGRARAAEQHARDVHASRPVQIAWAVIPALGLLLVLYLTWRAVDQPQATPVDLGHSGVTIGASR